MAGSTYRSTDLTHWLALEVADRALADAGYPSGTGLPRQSTGVILGNSLTGEFSRANALRLRWPYVRRTVAAALSAKGWEEAELAEFLLELERDTRRPSPASTRICSPAGCRTPSLVASATTSTCTAVDTLWMVHAPHPCWR